jgi:cyclopropane fatty-acyl-phospholipid synthase-like methyltransferase
MTIDHQRDTADIYNRYVKEYVSKFMNLSLYKDTFNYIIDNVPLNGSVLELGCGPGNVIKYLKSKRTDLNIFGIDIAPEMIKEAERQNPDSRFEVMDIKDAYNIKEKFDAVIAAFCLPYLSYNDVPLLFANLDKLTKENSILYLSCMEGARERSGFEKTSFTGDNELYINYYERSELERLIKNHHFEIEAFYTKDYPETDGSVTTDLIYIASKG